MAKPEYIHASAVLVGAGGVLIRGGSGSGKTSLGLALVAAALAKGRHGAWVADDRTGLTACGGRLIASAHPAIAGHAERRGLGLVPVEAEPHAVIRLVVDCLGEAPERMPEPEALIACISGVTLPRISVAGGAADAPLVLAALELFGGA
jgi:HPr kinase/phosphorylase